jgi:uncharacterized protein YjbJ (UPF0337 family)
MSGLEDRARGEGTELKGKAKEALGRATGDPELRAHGEADQAKGKARQLLGRLKTALARVGGNDRDERDEPSTRR